MLGRIASIMKLARSTVGAPATSNCDESPVEQQHCLGSTSNLYYGSTEGGGYA